MNSLKFKYQLQKLFSIVLFCVISLNPIYTQSNFPSVDFHKTITANDGLKNRIVRHINRSQNGIYLFSTGKLQFYTGHRFINESESLPDLLLLTNEFLLSEDFKVYDLYGTLVHANEFSGDIIQSYKEDEVLKVVEQIDSLYNSYSWTGTKWEINFSITHTDSLDNLLKVDERIYKITTDHKLEMQGQEMPVFDGSELPLQVTPNNSIIKPVNDYVYFSFRNKKGIFRLNQFNNVEIIDSQYVLHDVYKDETGKCLVLGRDKIRINESAYLIDEDGSIHNWNELLSYSDIIADVYSENFNEELVLGTYKGVEMIRFVNSKSYISSFFKNTVDNRGFGRVITDVSLDDNQNVFAISEHGIIAYRKDNDFEYYNIDVGDGFIEFSFYNDVDKKFWIGLDYVTNRGKLFSFDPETRKIGLEYDTPTINCSYKSDNGNCYIGGNDGNVYEVLKDSLKTCWTLEVLENQEVLSLYVEDKILIGTRDGLFSVDSFNSNSKSKRLHASLISQVRTIEKYGNQYFLGTYGFGIYILDEDFEIVKQVNDDCCLLNDYVYSIEQDEDGQIWAGTNEGLYILDTLGAVKGLLKVKDGLSHNEFNTQASEISSDGILYFGTLNGLTSLDYKQYKGQDVNDYFVQEILAYKGNDVFYGGSEENSISFNFKPDSILVVAESCGFEDYYLKYSSKNNFSYEGNGEFRLDENLITIYNPSYGDHLIYVNGLEKRPLSFSIKIDYLSFVRRGILFLLFLSILGYLLYKYLERRSKKKLQESELRIQMAQIKLEALRSQLNPHFIFNSLGAIGYYIQTKESRIANNYLTKFAKLIRSFLESSKNEFISVIEEIQLITYYLELEKMRFVDAFEYEITCDPEVDKSHDTLPTMMIQPFIENSIIHGISHRKDKEGMIKVHFECQGESLVCSIDDNGVGRKKSAELKNMSLKKHKSRAMEIINDRIKYSEMSNEVSLSIEIKDKFEQDKPLGTTVIITVTNKSES